MNDKRRRSDLVNQDKVRGSLDGSKRTHNIGLLDATWRLVDRVVETGKGKYGSALVDHSVRFFISILSGDTGNLETMIQELEPFVVTPNFAINLRKMADMWDNREADIEL